MINNERKEKKEKRTKNVDFLILYDWIKLRESAKKKENEWKERINVRGKWSEEGKIVLEKEK